MAVTAACSSHDKGKIMKKIIALAALAAVSACSETETAPDAAATEEVAAAETAEVMAADGGPAYGNFRITRADGTVIMEDVREDGTWTATMADGSTETGTWVQKPGEYCTTDDKEGAVEKCHPEKIDENGVWVSTDPEDGETVTVERVEVAAE